MRRLRIGRIEGKIKKMNRDSRRQKMAIVVAFKFLKIVIIREARIRKGVPQVGSARLHLAISTVKW